MRGNQVLKYLDRIIGAMLLKLAGFIKRKNNALPVEPKKIVVVKLSAIGDTILLYPALRSLRARYPSAEIIAVCTKINYEIFSRCKYVDRVISVNPKNLVLRPFSIVPLLIRLKPDIAVDFDQWTRLSAVLAVLTRPGYLVGFSTEGQSRHFAFDSSIPHNRTMHEIECFLELSKAAGALSVDPTLEYPITDLEVRDAAKFLEDKHLRPRGFIVMHPETPRHGKQRHWPAESFVELGKLILAHTDKYILLTGTAAEQPSNAVIKSLLGERAICVPQVSIGFLAALFKQATALVCGNTGIMHLACAVNTPVVALHGPTNALKWGPRTSTPLSVAVTSPLFCSPCLYLGFEYGCDSNACMKTISAVSVFEHIKNILQTQP